MASEVFFTSNPSEFEQLEGLYINEKDPPAFIEGVSLNTVGIGGVTVRGPETPQVITSVGRFLEVYGGRDYGSGGALVNEVWAALLNKSFGTIVVERVVASDAVVASVNVEDAIDGTGTEIATISASSAGAWGANVSFNIVDASNGDSNSFNLRVRYLGEEILYENLTCANGTSDQADVDEIIGDDIGRFIDVTVLAAGRPQNNADVTESDFVAARDTDGFVPLAAIGAAYTTTTGSNGTLANTDFTATVTSLANYQGIALVLMAGDSGGFQSDVNAQVVTEAATANDRSFVVWSGTHGNTPAQEVTDLGTDITTRSDRIWWCYNSAYTRDPDTGLEIQRPATEWMAAIIAQTDVDIHPGSREAATFLAGIRRVTDESLSRGDLITLRDAGISTLERLPGRFQFRSGVTTLLTTGKTEITRRRMTDFLQLSAAETLVDIVKAKNTRERRIQISGLLIGFSNGLRDEGRVVEDFSVIQAGINTDAARARGVEKVLWRVKLIGHILHLVLETEIGTTVTITEASA